MYIFKEFEVLEDEGFIRPPAQDETPTKKLKRYAKQIANQAVFISELKTEIEKLKKQLENRDNKITAVRQEARGRELKLEAEIAKLREQPRPHDGADGGGAAVGADGAEVKRLREHLRTQSQKIMELHRTLEVHSLFGT